MNSRSQPFSLLPGFDVFVSYRREFETEANLLKAELEARGLRTFVDVRNIPGGPFPQALRDVIENTPNFLVLVTPGALDSCNDPRDWMRREFEIAMAGGCEIVCVATTKDESWRPGLPDCMSYLGTLTPRPMEQRHLEDEIDTIVGDFARDQQRIADRMKQIDDLARDPGFERWQVDVLERAYRPLIPESCGDALIAFPVVLGRKYPTLAIEAHPQPHGFQARTLGKDLRIRKLRLLERPKSASAPVPAWVAEGPLGLERETYFKLLALTGRVERWNMHGFSIRSLELDGECRLVAVEAELTTYGENCLTSHFMNYRLPCEYETRVAMSDLAYDLAPLLAFESVPDRPDHRRLSFKVDENLFPLISVQALVIYRDRDTHLDDDEEKGAWRVVAMERAANLATDSGYWQFPPAGGFEIYGREDEHEDYVRAQYDLRTAIFREFLEEIYGDLDMTCDFGDEHAADLSGSPGQRAIAKALRGGGLSIHLLGVVVGLATLRPEFSFLIVVDDPKLFELRYQVNLKGETRDARWLCGSREGRGEGARSRLTSLRLDRLGVEMRRRTWHAVSATAAELFARETRRPDGWLRRRHPDLPEIELR